MFGNAEDEIMPPAAEDLALAAMINMMLAAKGESIRVSINKCSNGQRRVHAKMNFGFSKGFRFTKDEDCIAWIETLILPF